MDNDHKDLIASLLIILVVCALILALCWRRNRKEMHNNHSRLPKIEEISLAIYLNRYTYEELSKATNEFSDVNIIGRGGFGYVYKGVLPDGQAIAIKQLSTESRQGECEFRVEVEMINRVHHRHLVSLFGYCISGVQRMLVYEFVSNKTLQFHLHGKDRPTMDWSTRMKIAIGSAKGLTYLHEDCHPKIIHRDIKAANILLDGDFEAKVADFGVAKFSPDANSHVSTRVMGTFGYLAPDYAASGKLSEKSDVFSFGVVLLELITGRKPIYTTESSTDHSISIVQWARPLLSQALENNNIDGLVDPRLKTNYNHDEMIRMIACAASCVCKSAGRRPRMSQIVRALKENISLDDLYVGSTSEEYNYDLNEIMKRALEASQEQGGSEYSGPNSEHGQHPSATTNSG